MNLCAVSAMRRRTGPIYGRHTINDSRVNLLRYAIADELTGSPRPATTALLNLFPTWNSVAIDFLAQCLCADPNVRPKCPALLQHSLFSQDGFANEFLDELQQLVAKESTMNSLTFKRLETRPSRICRSSIGRLAWLDDGLTFSWLWSDLFWSLAEAISISRLK